MRVREREKKVTVSFDNGSQRTFISARAVNRLGLEPERSEELRIKTLSNREPDMAVKRFFIFSLSLLFEGIPVEVEALK